MMNNSIELVKCKENEFHSLKNFFEEEKETDLFKEHLSKILDWNLIFTAVNSYTHSFNEPLVRMVKSLLLSKCIEFSSHKKMYFADKVGYDFITEFEGKEIKVEFKSGKNLFQGDKSSYTKKIKLDNTNGKSSFFKTYEKTFDYLLLVDENKAAIISYEDVQKYIMNDGDGRSVKINRSDLTFVKECTVVKTNQKIFLDNILDKLYNEGMEQLTKLYYS